MNRWGFAVVVALLVCGSEAGAQPLSESYYRENPSWIDADLWTLEGESFFISSRGENPFEEYAIYGFSFVDYAERGESYPSESLYLGDIDIRNPLQRYPDYSLQSLLRRSPASVTYHLNSPNELDATASSQQFSTSPFDQSPSSDIRVQLSSRTYRLGVSYRAVFHRGDSLALSLAAGGRGGRDANIEGLYSRDSHLWLAAERRWDKDDWEHSLQLALMVAPTERSQRSWNTEEVFQLAGDDHYNSYWGYQEGKVRSARVRRTTLPALYASWNLDERYILARLNITAFVQGGRSSRTSLDWAGASNPQPDHYTYLPSYQADPEAAAIISKVWHTHNSDFTQINFSKIYEAAALQPTESPYLLTEECSDLLTAKIDISGTLLGSNFRRIGLRGGYHRSREHNLPVDLFGASEVAEGLFTPYNHTPTQAQWSLYGTLSEPLGGGRFYGSLEFGGQSLAYHSQITDYSTQDSFTTLRGRMAWSRSIGSRLKGGLDGYFNHTAPFWEQLYGAAQGAMRRNPYADAESIVGGNIWSSWKSGSVGLYANIYAHLHHNLSHSENFWDAPSATYASLLSGSLSTLSMGARVSIEASLSRSLKLEGHVALSSNRYIGNGVADIVAFDNLTTIVEQTTLNTKGLPSSASPALATALRATWFAPSGWMVGAEVACVAKRYMEPSLLLCSDYARSQWLSEEDYDRVVVRPKSLGEATNLSLFIYRRWGAVSLSASVRNLLNSTEAYSAGYQPSRLSVRSSDTAYEITPHSPRYQHIYPRHFYLSVGYEF